MVRRILAMAALSLIASASIARADARSIEVRSVEADRFPLVDVTVSVDGSSALTVGDVHIAENGAPVDIVKLDTLGGTGRSVDAVLAIDVSNSMRGAPLETALAAGRAFVSNVPATLPVGVVSFADEPVVRSAITGDRTAAAAAVTALTAQTSQGTALFEAVVTASKMFTADDAQHNLVLLTDGRNTTGPADLDAAVRAAHAAGVNVFTVALEGGSADQVTLDALAQRTGGRSSFITRDDLTAVYTDLAREFGGQYVVTYRSKAPFGTAVQFEVRTPFGTGSARFLTPALHGLAADGSAAAKQPLATSDVALVVVAFLIFLAIANGLVLMRSAAERRRREAQLRSRVVVDGALDTDAFDPGEANAVLPRALVEAAERTAGRAGVLSSVGLRLHQAGWEMRVGDLLSITALVGLVAGAGGWFFLGPLGLAAAIPAVVAPFLILSSAASKRLRTIQAQLADTLLVIASSLRAGHSFLQALDTVTKEIDEPGRSEFTQTMQEIRLGREVDDALDSLVERTGSRDLEWAVTAIKIQRKIGGNLAEVLESVANTIRERETLRRQVRVLSAEGRISSLVLTVLPILIGAYLVTVNPEYLRGLTSSSTGVVLLGGCGVLMVVGYVWMQRIVKIDDI